MIYDQFKNNEVYKSFTSQSIVNRLASWTKARQDSQSNYQLLMAGPSFKIEEISRESIRFSYNLFNKTADMEMKGFVFVNRLSNIEWETGKDQSLRIPKLTGHINGNQYELNPLNDADEIRFPKAISIGSSNSIDIPYKNIQYIYGNAFDGVKLFVKENCWPKIVTESELNIDKYINDLKVIPSITFKGKKKTIEIPIFNKGICPIEFLLPEDIYTIELNNIDDSFTAYISLYDFGLKSCFDNFLNISTQEIVSPAIFEIGKDKHTMEANTLCSSIESNRGNHNLVNFKNYLLMDHESNTPIEIDRIVKSRAHPFIWALSKEENSIYLFDMLDRHGKEQYNNKGRELVRIKTDLLDYKFQDSIFLYTHGQFILNDPTPAKYRMKVKINELNEEFYINKNGDEIGKENAWYDAIYSKGSWKEHRWNYVFPWYGTFKFTLETLTNDRKLFNSEKIINIGYKKSISKINLDQIGTIEDIGIKKDKLIVKTNNEFHELDFIYSSAYIDEESLTIYTANKFDNVTGEY